MSDHITKALAGVVKILGTTLGRDRVCKLVQYITMYLHYAAKSKTDAVHPAFEKMHYNFWITRKLLRFGLIWHYIKEIKHFTDPKNVKEEQVGAQKKSSKGIGKLLNNSEKDAEGGPAPNEGFDIFKFDTPGLKALSTICDLLFCVTDIPLFLKEMNVLEMSESLLKKVSSCKHLFWLFSCIFTLAKEYILIKAISVKVKRFKKLAFPEGQINEEEAKQFDGKCKEIFPSSVTEFLPQFSLITNLCH